MATAPSRPPAPGPRPLAGPGEGSGGPGRPEDVRILLGLVAALLAGETIHQLLGIVMGLADLGPLRHGARRALAEQGVELDGAALTAVAGGSVLLAGVVALLFVALLGVAGRAVARRAGWSDAARRLLVVFGAWFAVRAGALLLAERQGMGLPVAWYAVDGSLQIIIGVLGALTMVFGMREAVRDHVVRPGRRDRDAGDDADDAPRRR